MAKSVKTSPTKVYKNKHWSEKNGGGGKRTRGREMGEPSAFINLFINKYLTRDGGQ